MLAPNGDSDNDGVSDGIEVYGPVKTDPKDSASFIDYVIPSRTILDYSVDNNITLDFARFYPDYSNSSAIPFNIKAGTFIGNLAPLFQMRNIPKGFSAIPRIPGYSPIGQAMNFEYFPIVSGEEVEVPIPFTNTQITSGTECFMVIRKNDSCDIVQPTSVNPGYLTVSVDSTVKSVILMQKGMSHGSAVAYLDGGMIYSHDNGTSISTNIVLRDCQPEHVNGALMKVFYTDISDPFNHVNDSVLFPLDTLRVNEGYLLKTRDIVRFAGAVKVNKMTLDIPNYYISYTDSTTHNVSRGQSLVFNCDRDIGYFSAIKNPVSASYGINYALESVSIDGEGRILQHRSGDSVTYSYEYYMKDHLGSTRMVINDQNSITERVAYQSYGTINPLDSSSPALPSREKFTGKEFDTQGADFARVEFDIAVKDFDMSTGSGFIRAGYRDVAAGKEFFKIYMARYDRKNRALRFTGSESFTGDIEIVQMLLIASGAPGWIYNIASMDSFLVSPGKTGMIRLDVASSEIIGTPVDTNLYSVHAAVNNRSYFSGMQLYYFGARYYDPELGIWLSVDAEDQFANAYGYANNPLIMVDPDGNFALQAAIVSAIIGSAIGTVQGAINAHNQRGNFWDYAREISIWSNVHGAIGFVSGGLGGGVSSNIMSGVKGIGGAVAAGAASGAIGGAISYTGNYAAQYAYGGFDQNYLDAGEFFGGLGKSTLIGGGIGAAAGGLTYSAKTIWNNTRGTWTSEFAQSNASNVPQKPNGVRPGTDAEASLKQKFGEFAKTNPHQNGESAGFYKIKRSLFNGKYYVNAAEPPKHFLGTQNSTIYRGPRPDIFIHSHPNTSFPSAVDYLNAAKNYKALNMSSYLLGSDANLYQMSNIGKAFFQISF